MTLRPQKILLCCFAGIAVVFAVLRSKKPNDAITLPFYNSADFTPEWIVTDVPSYAAIHTIAPFRLVDQEGETVTEKTFAGKIYVADFFFTTCGSICPTMTANMLKLQNAFRDDNEVLLLSHTVTPEIDSVAVLKSYAEGFGAIKGKWHFVTGTKKEIYTLARDSYFADQNLGTTIDENDFLHTENFLLIDRRGRIRGVYNGTLPVEIDRIIADVKTLKLEK